jgi:hypothetical protein
MHCVAGAVGLQLKGRMGFYLRVLFMGFLPLHTKSMVTVYIL